MADELSAVKDEVRQKLGGVGAASQKQLVAVLESNVDADIRNLTPSVAKGFAESESSLQDVRGGYNLDPVSNLYLMWLYVQGEESRTSKILFIHFRG